RTLGAGESWKREKRNTCNQLRGLHRVAPVPLGGAGSRCRRRRRQQEKSGSASNGREAPPGGAARPLSFFSGRGTVLSVPRSQLNGSTCKGDHASCACHRGALVPLDRVLPELHVPLGLEQPPRRGGR